VKRGLQWRLISDLPPNHLSIVSQDKEALQEMLTLYNYTQSQTAACQIQGIFTASPVPPNASRAS
jgi:type VI secretion system protein ImpG